MIRPSGRSRTGLYLISSLCAFLVFAAQPSQARTVHQERSHSRPPRWTVMVPDADDTYLYYVGRATGAATLEAAETDAAAEVVRQIVTEVGIEAAFSYERLRNEAGLLLDDRIALAGDSRIVGLKRVETYYLKQVIEEKNSVRTTYDVSLLARFPRESLARETDRLAREASARAAESENRLSAALAFEREGAWDAAWAAIEAVFDLTGAPAPAASGRDALRLAESRRKACEGGRRLSPRLRRLTVRPVAVQAAAGEAAAVDEPLTAALENALLEQGFRPDDRDSLAAAGVLPAVEISFTEEETGRLDAGFYLSRWNVSFKVLDPDGRLVLFSEVYTVKGFGTDPQKAVLDARRKLRVEVIEKFSREARDRFNLLFAGEPGPSRVY
ncbi:MAG: hypothetical protein V1794_03600 [Candidatus Glassbacteria bacterium]